MKRFGDELRSEREQKRVTLETICAVTKVSVRHLEALEGGNYGELPGGVFRKGILRSYLGAVGLEESPWMERFETALLESGTVQAESNDWVEFAENVRRNRGGVEAGTAPRWIGVAAMMGTLVMFGWGVWKFVLHGHLFL
jgi:cytoskeleton protein RodZ